MSRFTLLLLFYLAAFLQAGAYGLTFLLPRLFKGFGANEVVVGQMLFLTTLATLATVYFAGHMADRFGRMKMLSIACCAISAALALYGGSSSVGPVLISASLLLGFGWGITYALAPIVLTKLVEGHERIRYFALLSVAIMAGFGLSPVFAALLEAGGIAVSGAFYATAALCLISAVLFWILIKPARGHALKSGPEGRSSLTVAHIVRIINSPARLPVIMVCIGASVFAGMNNFQTVMADERGLDYANYFLIYTVTVVLFRVVLARFKGGTSPYVTIAMLQFVMCGSVVLFLYSGDHGVLYGLVAFLFGIGYGVSYPILAAMAASDAEDDIVPQTLQLFALTYFIGIFGFPLIAGWLIVAFGSATLLWVTALLAGVEATMALLRGQRTRARAII
ncbi:MFS transporter [Sedimentitalea sp. CY04]|uniref:MFS transporter n=1 Tax=Parasedimentitalea denitrificans TaxID=2211118 RepID=A0ABX0W389_9RHOB|nr:MFS transporter [Sedimentitalea sp. CY04]NIZ60092.1 MFS transporter [Sedimentitalea sp. CY04]